DQTEDLHRNMPLRGKGASDDDAVEDERERGTGPALIDEFSGYGRVQGEPPDVIGDPLPDKPPFHVVGAAVWVIDDRGIVGPYPVIQLHPAREQRAAWASGVDMEGAAEDGKAVRHAPDQRAPGDQDAAVGNPLGVVAVRVRRIKPKLQRTDGG